jgi:hypothetical protein
MAHNRIAGLADYQIRTWTGWHHHITLSLLAMLALLSISFEVGEDADFFDGSGCQADS